MIGQRMLLVPALLAGASLAFAGSGVKSSNGGPNVEDEVGERTAQPAPAAASYPDEVPKDTLWIAYPRLRDVPEKVGTHGVMRVPSKGVGWAVGFLTGPEPAKGGRRSGRCATNTSPTAPTPDVCRIWSWIAAEPGGAPLPGCVSGPGGGASVSLVVWYVLGKEAQRPRGCVLEPNRRYYCHYTPTGWQDHPAHCDRMLNSPVSPISDL